MNNDNVNALLNVVSSFNFKMHNPKYHNVSYTDIEKVKTRVELQFNESLSRRKCIESFVALYLIMFTVYDGYLEEKYNLEEGNSFRNHYVNLPSVTDIEKIQKGCYRIMKIIRNTIQHKLSALEFNNNCLNISYEFHNRNFLLSISNDGLCYLNTIIINILSKSPYHTKGHYEEIIKTLYGKLIKEINLISDDIGTQDLCSVDLGIGYDVTVRYMIKNAILDDNNESIIMRYHDEGYSYKNDYVYNLGEKVYILPEEIGEADKEKGEIVFSKQNLNSKWEFIKNIVDDIC